MPKPQQATPPTTAPRRLYFGPPPSQAPAKSDKPKRQRKPKVKADPKFVAAARELRDRYLEHVNRVRSLPAVATKYDVSRAVSPLALPAAA